MQRGVRESKKFNCFNVKKLSLNQEEFVKWYSKESIFSAVWYFQSTSERELFVKCKMLVILAILIAQLHKGNVREWHFIRRQSHISYLLLAELGDSIEWVLRE